MPLETLQKDASCDLNILLHFYLYVCLSSLFFYGAYRLVKGPVLVLV